jgi:hypothetical protein
VSVLRVAEDSSARCCPHQVFAPHGTRNMNNGTPPKRGRRRGNGLARRARPAPPPAGRPCQIRRGGDVARDQRSGRPAGHARSPCRVDVGKFVRTLRSTAIAPRTPSAAPASRRSSASGHPAVTTRTMSLWKRPASVSTPSRPWSAPWRRPLYRREGDSPVAPMRGDELAECLVKGRHDLVELVEQRDRQPSACHASEISNPMHPARRWPPTVLAAA